MKKSEPTDSATISPASLVSPSMPFLSLGLLAVFGLMPATALRAVEFDRDVVKRCLGGVVTEFGVDLDDGLTETEVEVDIDEGRPAERSRILIRMDGRTIYKRTKRTNANGEIKVRRVLRSGSQPRLFIARITRLESGKSCQVRIRVPR